ncbi:MAG: PD-(D/E)XK nuclease family protein [Planctomycetes bacterium]|nr:PD-(D/E)XK nuclease family protein [Planctomycetota bacterium]
MTEPGVEQGRRSDFCTGLIKLVLDPQFAAFAQQANRPNLFGIVGRTYTETWHSMLLGWLLDPSGTHGLGSFALRRLLLAIAIDEGTFAPSGGRSLARTVAVFGEFERVQVLPNERDRRELKIPLSPGKTGRLDVFVSGITLKRENREAVILIEQKVFAAPDTGQCRDYHAWLDREHAGKFHIPILLAPAPDPGTRLVEDERWFEPTTRDSTTRCWSLCSNT